MYKWVYDKFKHWYHGGTIWFYSDPHFADDEVNRTRENYIGDNGQVYSINKSIGKNDTIIFLGDIGDVSYIPKIRGYKVLIMGNHDAGAAKYKRNSHILWRSFDTFEDAEAAERKHEIDYYEAHMHEPFIGGYRDNKLFDEVYEGPLFINKRILLSHEPIDYPYALNIHGHDHSCLEKYQPGLNVCAEWINYIPISINQIMKSGLLNGIDDIHRATIDKASNK